MAAPWNPPVKNEDFEFSVSLVATDGTGFKANPTLAAGDVTIRKDGGTAANIATLPAAVASGIEVEVELTATEMNADKVFIMFVDQTSPKEWEDLTLCILTTS